MRQNRLFLYCLIITALISLLACSPPPSILEIKPSDRTIFYPLLQRQVEHRSFASYDGTRLSYTFMENDSARFAVAFIHGIAAHSLLYLPLGDSLVAAGGRVYLLDIRGHGSSDGEPGDVPDDEALAKDAHAFFMQIQSENPKLPIVVAGHSLGTFIWESAIAKFDDIQPAGVVLLAGGMNPQDMHHDLKKLGKGFVYVHPGSLMLSTIGFHTRPIEIVLPKDSLLSAGHFNTRYTLKFLRGQRFTTAEFDHWLERTREFPVLMIVGDRDEVMSVPALRKTFQLLKARDKTFVEVPDATHISIIYESTPAMNAWLQKRFLLKKNREGLR